MLSEEINFFNNNQAILARWYPHSFIVIIGHKVYGGFPSILQAYAAALKRFEIGHFLVIGTQQKFSLNREDRLPGQPVWSGSFFGWLVALPTKLFNTRPV